jgi:hypothetical protein
MELKPAANENPRMASADSDRMGAGMAPVPDFAGKWQSGETFPMDKWMGTE